MLEPPIKKDFRNITGKNPLVISSITGEGIKELLKIMLDDIE